MKKGKIKMPEQNPDIRKNNFFEVSLGYSIEMAKAEAGRCMQCKAKPCVEGCPVNVQIPEFINLVAKGQMESAYETLKGANALPAVCGRVCPQETQCEKYCVRKNIDEPVAIGRLERFTADWFMANKEEKTGNIIKKGKKVAVVGSGPAGLTCAGTLARKGFDVTIYEAFHKPGGVLAYGIPEFRLPKELVKKEIDMITALGVEIKTNMVMGKSLSFDDLENDGYEAVFIGSGAGLPKFMGIPGENLNGVYSANEFLTRINLMKAYLYPVYDTPVKIGRVAAVIGGGNVAMDAARCALRLGAEKVYVIYRRSEAEMPARREEIEHAREEGIIFKMLSNPVKILGTEEGWVKGIQCTAMELGKPDKSGRSMPVAVQGSEHIIEAETVIMAIGQSPNPLIAKAVPDLAVNNAGGINICKETGATNKSGIFAGGDVATGAATVILAMGAGKKAAEAMEKYIEQKNSQKLLENVTLEQ